MNDLNQTIIIGRLGKDPELKTLPSGDMSVTTFSVACGWKTKQKEGTEWFNVTAFGKTAEVCAQYLTKGSKVFIQGTLRTDKYQKDGVEKSYTKLIADKVQFLDGKQEGTKPEPAVEHNVTDDIPF